MDILFFMELKNIDKSLLVFRNNADIFYVRVVHMIMMRIIQKHE